MSRVCTWKSISACEFIAERGVTREEVVCRPCRDDIGRAGKNPSYIPRWEKADNIHRIPVTGAQQLVGGHSSSSLGQDYSGE